MFVLLPFNQFCHFRPSHRVRKKMENYAEHFGNIVRKKVMIKREKMPDYAEISKINKTVPLAFFNV